DEVDTRQVVLERDLLRPEVLLHRDREVSAALHRRVVADDHALGPRDASDPRDDARAGSFVVVETVRRERGELEERRRGVEKPLDALARQELASGQMLLARAFRPAERGCGRALLQL